MAPEPLPSAQPVKMSGLLFLRNHLEGSMQATVQWNDQNGMLFVASTGSGHVVTMDGAPEGGGHNRAARPMELLLAGTGGDRKSTRLNSSHVAISYAVICLK